MKDKIIALTTAIIIEMVLGVVIGTIPDPYSSEQIQQLMNTKPVNSTYEQSESWLSLAQKENDAAHFSKSVLRLFLLVLAPIITGCIFILKIL